MNKGFIFAGDSFTWAEGLELFSDFPSIQHYKESMIFSMNKEKNHAHSPEYKNSHRLFQQKHRFPRLVADHFNSWEDVYDRNGGCPYSVMDELFVQIDRTPLSDVSNIIIQITDVWRSVPIITAAENLYFSRNGNKYTLSQKDLGWADSYGDGSGLQYLNIDEPITFDTFPKWCDSELIWEFDGLLHNVFYMGLAYEALIKGVSDSEYRKMVSRGDGSYNPDTSSVPISNIYKFILNEFREFGNSVVEVHKNLEVELCRRYIGFVKKFIKPLADEHNVRITFIPPFNDTWRSFRDMNDSYYNENSIKFYDGNKEYPSWEGELTNKYNISHTKGFEWSRNLHPNLEGHKIFANSIIKHLEGK